MQSLKGKIILITGASAGIGHACSHQFAALGAKLILAARRRDKLEALAQSLHDQYNAEIFVATMDVANQAQVSDFYKKLPQDWQQVDILVNNAGMALGLDTIQEGDLEDWSQMIDANVKGLLYVTRLILPGMLARNSGHVINLGSISAYEVYRGGAVYCATKFAVRALSEGIKMDVHGSGIRVSEIDPGMVETEFSQVRFKGDSKRAETVYQGVNCLQAEDIADAIVYCATRPAHVDVRAIKIYPTDQTAAHMVKRND